MSIRRLADCGYSFARVLQSCEDVRILGGLIEKDQFGRFVVRIQLWPADWVRLVRSRNELHFKIEPSRHLYELYHAEFVYGGTVFVTVLTEKEYEEFLEKRS